MIKIAKKIILLGFFIFQSCSQVGVIKTDYIHTNDRYFPNKDYKIKNNFLHNSSYVVKNFVFSDSLTKRYTPTDIIKFFNDKCYFIIIRCDDNGILVGMDEDDSYDIYIKVDTLMEKEFELNDNNTVIKRNLSLARFLLDDIKGSIYIKSISKEKMCCSIKMQIGEIIQNNNHIPFPGRMSGSFCLPIKSN